jgi:hypothetical protein
MVPAQMVCAGMWSTHLRALCPVLQIAPALQVAVRAAYYDAMQHLNTALLNVCADFQGEKYSRVSCSHTCVSGWSGWLRTACAATCKGCSRAGRQLLFLCLPDAAVLKRHAHINVSHSSCCCCL